MLNAYDFNTSSLPSAITSKWQDIDKGLKEFIVKGDKNGMKEDFFILIKEPISIMTEEDEANFLAPKPNYTRNDLRVLMSYTKYLIDQNRTQEIPEIYIRLIDGINNYSYDGSLIAVVFKIIMNKIALKSLKYDLPYLSKKEKSQILSKSPKLFTYKLDDFYRVFKNSIKNIISEKKATFIKIFPKKRVDKIFVEVEKKVLDFNNHLFRLATKKEQEKIIKQFQKDSKEFINKNLIQVSFLNQKTKKYPDYILSLDNYNLPKVTTKEILSDELIIDTLFYTTFFITTYELVEESKQEIELNKEVLEMLRAN
jgi:hypothetical protein